MSWCWLWLLWFVQLKVATCCFVHLYTWMHVFVCTCTFLPSKWGDKGGAESLMSSLTGRIYVSLFLLANTCCSGRGKIHWILQCNTHSAEGRKKVSGKVFINYKSSLEGGHSSLLVFHKTKQNKKREHLYTLRFTTNRGSLSHMHKKENNRFADWNFSSVHDRITLLIRNSSKVCRNSQ